ncbi:MAG: DUF1538 domain-containing protein [Bacilli bacterium]|jgi:hypothetical protein|nr:DUF1538 domain-containing protein [Bacilli bacterium]
MGERANADRAPKKSDLGIELFWLRKLGESFLSVVPILIVVTVLYFTRIIKDFYLPGYVSFLVAAFFIGLGLALFTVGAEQSMSRIGQVIGETLFRKRKLWLIIVMTFLIGLLVTVAEPDLRVMASQIGWNEIALIAAVGIGVGLFVVFGVLRILFNKNLNIMFVAFYGIVFALAGVVNPKFLPIAFDSGGVTTGPVTVPFILAFGAGLAASRSAGGHSGENAFGLTALASVGPIICTMVMSLFANIGGMEYVWSPSDLVRAATWADFWPSFKNAFVETVWMGRSEDGLVLGQAISVAIAIVPLALFFIFYDLAFVRLSFKEILRILVGLFYAYLGLVVFMSAVDLGFLPVAQRVGHSLGGDGALFPIAVLVGGLFGLFGVFAEPAVHVLVRQIADVSEGTIKPFTVLVSMALGIAIGVALAIVRAHYRWPILYFMVPGYLLAIGLSFVVPRIYTAIAFDSGGVASGPMASAFVMPFAIGFVVSANGGENVFSDAFGCVAMIALMPLIVIQLMGLFAETKRKIVYARARKKFVEPGEGEIVFFGEEGA